MNFIGKKFNNGWHGVANLDDTIGSQNFLGRGAYVFVAGPTRTVMAYEAKTLTRMQQIGGYTNAAPASLTCGRQMVFSPNCKFLVVSGAGTTNGYQMFYTKDFNFNDPYTPLQTNPGTTVQGISFSANGSYFATGDSGTKTYVYNVQSDLSSSWTNVTNFTRTGAVVCSTAFSPNGTWFATAGAKDTNTNDYVKVFLQSDFSTAVTLDNQPAGKVFCVAFNPASTLMACAHTTTPYLTVYDTGASFTKKADVSSLPAGNATGVQFSPDGAYLIVSHATTPFQTIYKVSDWSKLATPFDTGPTAAGYASYSPNGDYLAVGASSTLFFMIYDISGESYTRRAITPNIHTMVPNAFAWIQNGQTYSL